MGKGATAQMQQCKRITVILNARAAVFAITTEKHNKCEQVKYRVDASPMAREHDSLRINQAREGWTTFFAASGLLLVVKL